MEKPIVFKNKVYRYEYVRKVYKPNTTGDSYSRFIDHESGEPTPAFAEGYHLGSAFVDGDSVYVTAVDIWDGEHTYCDMCFECESNAMEDEVIDTITDYIMDKLHLGD